MGSLTTRHGLSLSEHISLLPATLCPPSQSLKKYVNKLKYNEELHN